jgi:Lrp/AsnC family transcriptional regulator for asnA, asnC and gidA
MRVQKATIDRLDRQIIAALARDGRISYRELARMLDVSEGTIRMRVSRLQDEDLVRITLVGSPLALGVGMNVMIMLRVKPGHVRETAEALVKFPNVRFVGLSFGPADVCIQSLHKDIGDLHHFVSELIPRAAPYVTSTETFQLAEVMKSSWTWGDWFEYIENDGDQSSGTPQNLPAQQQSGTKAGTGTGSEDEA